MKIKDSIEYAAVAALLGLCRILPETMVYAVFKGLGHITRVLLASRRKIALLNTEIAFPEKPLSERKRIVRQHFLNLAESMALNAMIMSGRISDDRLKDMVETEGWEKFAKTVNESDMGVLTFSAHIGNWELMVQYLAMRLEKPLYVISRKSNNMLLEERVILPLRKHYGVNVVYKKNAIMKIVKALKKGGVSGLLIDQRFNLQEGISMKFFGREIGTTTTSALLQIRFGVLACPIFMIRSGPRRYRFILGDPVPWTDNGKPMDEQVKELTQIHQKIIEDIIRQYPDQWFWVHDRWSQMKKKRKR